MSWSTPLLIGTVLLAMVGLVYIVRSGFAADEPAPGPGANRRKHPRVKPNDQDPVRVQIIGADFLDAFRANDISVGGLSVTVPHLFEGCRIEEEVELIVTLPKKRAFQARGQIRHLRKGRNGAVFGVMFTEIEEQNRTRVGFYVDTHADRIL